MAGHGLLHGISSKARLKEPGATEDHFRTLPSGSVPSSKPILAQNIVLPLARWCCGVPRTVKTCDRITRGFVLFFWYMRTVFFTDDELWTGQQGGVQYEGSAGSGLTRCRGDGYINWWGRTRVSMDHNVCRWHKEEKRERQGGEECIQLSVTEDWQQE